MKTLRGCPKEHKMELAMVRRRLHERLGRWSQRRLAAASTSAARSGKCVGVVHTHERKGEEEKIKVSRELRGEKEGGL